MKCVAKIQIGLNFKKGITPACEQLVGRVARCPALTFSQQIQLELTLFM